MSALHVSVLPRHIEDGEVCNPRYCPVALALTERLDEFSTDRPDLSVYGHYATIDGVRISLPEAVDIFVDDFDANEDVRPFDFEVFIPEEVLDAITARAAALELATAR